MKKLLYILVIYVLMASSGCATTASQKGGVVGAITGGVTGALLTPRNPLVGGIIGAMIGGAFGASITEISTRAARKAAVSNKPVRYVSDDRRIVYLAKPIGYNRYTRCRKVRVRIWKDNRLVLTRISEVCTGNKPN